MQTGIWIVVCAAAAVVSAAATYILQNKRLAELKEKNIKTESLLESEKSASARLESEKAELADKNESLYSELSLKTEECAKKTQEAHSEAQEKGRLLSEKTELLSKNAELNAELQKALANFSAESEKNKWLDSADKNLREAFSTISKDIIDRNNNAFLTQANDKLNDFAKNLDQKMSGERQEMTNVINPVGEQLKELQKQVTAMEKERASAYSGLNTSVDELKKQNEILKDETHSLAGALKNSTVRGKWGEAQLRRIAELSGMVEHIDYEEQLVNTEGQRPDMVVMLAGNRFVPVDSKVPMDDYMKYAESDDAAARKINLENHVKAVKKHIDSLSKKEYWKKEERSVQFVVMVIPYESGLSATFEGDNNIFQYAVERNVLLLSPMTFYAFLKSVSMGWTEQNVAVNAKKIKELSDELIERFNVILKNMEGIGKSLSKATESYNDAIKSYNSRLRPTFNKIKLLKGEPESPEADLLNE